MILKGYCIIAKKGKEQRFRLSEQFLRASNYAGIAFGNSGCAGVHAMSYALGAKYHVPHGESNYQFFTDVLKQYQKKNPSGFIHSLSELICEITIGCEFYTENKSKDGIEVLEALLAKILIRKEMKEYGVTQEDIEPFAQSTIDNQQRLLANNYVTLSKEEIQEIYQVRL